MKIKKVFSLHGREIQLHPDLRRIVSYPPERFAAWQAERARAIERVREEKDGAEEINYALLISIPDMDSPQGRDYRIDFVAAESSLDDFLFRAGTFLQAIAQVRELYR
ncbi:MAG TPA: hypothetical protein VJC21_04665 [Candidatus Nanoarchaeia archaeon]|nr:hypothetical protein [Candidatus Nanoarchaeia archaeon]